MFWNDGVRNVFNVRMPQAMRHIISSIVIGIAAADNIGYRVSV